MRNLKRVLSLALASAMLLGMMVMGAGAADKKASDLTDMNTVVNKEAVNLMVDLGIITGKPDGTYGPTEVVDRATMSTLIFRVLMATSDASGFVGVSSPLTDVKGHWAEGYINYCYSMGVVAGTGANAYDPSGKVAVVSAAKMLLVALGYDPKLSKYENDSMWSVNIMRDAQAAGLLNGIDQKSTDGLTRDNAAQMIFNAMFANTVTPDTERDQGVLYLKKYDPKATTLGQETYKLFKGTAVVDGIDADGTISTSTSGAHIADVEKMTASSDMLGNVVNVYYKSNYKVVSGAVVTTAGDYVKMYSSTATPAASTVVKSSNDGTKLADMIKKGDKKYVGDLDASVVYYLNGNTITPANVAAFDTSYAKAGIIIDLINNDTDAEIDVVKVTQKKVVTLTGDTSTKDVTGADTQVKVPGVINAFTSDNTVKTVVGYEGLKKDDVVLTYSFGTMTYIEKAATIEGTVSSRNSSNQLKIDGTYYGGSGLNSFDTKAMNFEDTYTFYLDNSKSIVKAVQKTDNATAAYVYIVETGFIDPTGGVDGAKGYAQARILNMDGTTEVVTLSKVGGDKVVKSGATTGEIDLASVANTFYTVKTDTKGAYELTVATAKTGITVADATNATITGGTAKFDTAHIGNSSTVFLVKSGTVDAPVYKTYTGINALPSMTLKVAGADTLATNSELLIKGGVVTHAFLNVVGGTVSGEVGEYFYVIPNTDSTYDFETVPKAGDVPEHNTVKAIVNGTSEDDAQVDDVTDVVKGGTALIAGTMYKVTAKDANGIITELTAVTTATADGDVRTGVEMSGDTLIAGGATSPEVVSVDSDTDIFFITKDGVNNVNYADVISDKTDKVMVAKKDSKGYAEIVYIIEVIEADVTVTNNLTVTIDTTTAPEAVVWAGGDGKTVATAKTTTLTKAGVTADKAFKLVLNATSTEADVSLVSGTVPTKTAASAATLSNVLVYQVTAEDGSTIGYYQITLAVTSA